MDERKCLKSLAHYDGRGGRGFLRVARLQFRDLTDPTRVLAVV